MTPEEAWTGMKPTVEHLRPFGCIAYAHIPAPKRSKLESKTVQGLFVGYCTESKAYRVFDPIKRAIHITRDVIFDERQNKNNDYTTRVQNKPCQPNATPESLVDSDTIVVDTSPVNDPEPNQGDASEGDNIQETLRELSRAISDMANRPRRSTRESKQPIRYDEESKHAKLAIVEPRTYKEAMESNETHHWQRAIEAKKNILERFNMSDCKSAPTPMDAGIKLSKDMSPKNDEENEAMKSVPYQNAIGSLMYVMTGTRPDIAYAVGATSVYNSNPGEKHWKAVKRIMRYLKGSRDFELEYKSTNDPMHGYSDADWGGNADDRRSTTGYTFIMSDAAVCWGSKRQPTVALSTTEAEYMALTQATKEAVWLKRFLQDIKLETQNNVRILTDNQSSMALAKNPVFHARTKHIDIRHHFIRERVEAGDIELVFCKTEDMLADVLTKGLTKEKHNRFTEGIGLRVSEE
jgi:hypothetical protein